MCQLVSLYARRISLTDKIRSYLCAFFRLSQLQAQSKHLQNSCNHKNPPMENAKKNGLLRKVAAVKIGPNYKMI